MKTRMFFAALAVVALVAANSLRAADEKPAAKDLKCPVSGKACKEGTEVEFNGGKVLFCCNNCPGAFKKDEAKYTAKANHQLVQTGQLVQAACPVSGKDVNAAETVDVGGVKVALCCGNCKAKLAKATGDEQIEMAFGADAAKKAYKPAKK